MHCDDPITTTAAGMVCPICKSTTFAPFNGRENARCASCLSMERTRLLWMVLEKFGLFRMGLRILHIAPEMALAMRFAELSGDRYHACDIDPSRYRSRFTAVRPIDLCRDLVKMPSRSFDLIIHTHVLEHIACDVEAALVELERMLAPGGHHFLSVPIRGEITAEDISDNLMPAHRAMMFGQDDHMRIFGVKSLTEMLGRVWGANEDPLITPRDLFSPSALFAAGIPVEAWSGYSSHSLFHHVRPFYSAASAPPPKPRPRPAPIETSASAAAPIRLLLHIGMSGPHYRAVQQWSAAHQAELPASGVVNWGDKDRAKLLFMAFASEKRIARGEIPFKHVLAPGEAAPTPEAGKAAFHAFLKSLDGGVGFISAETLWSFTKDEVEALRAQLTEWGVEAHILCFVPQPAAYLSTLVQQRVSAGLALKDMGLGVTQKLPFSYARLNAWADAFGDARMLVRDAADDPVARTLDALENMGARPLARSPASRAPEAAPGLTATKALLALNEVTGNPPPRVSALLRQALSRVEAGKFAVPESIAARTQSVLTRETALLSERFGLPVKTDESQLIDDHRVVYWTTEEVGRLLAELNALLLAQEK